MPQRRLTRAASLEENGSTPVSAEVVIPDPSPDAVDHLRTAMVLARLEEADDIAEVDEYRARAQALVDYLARKADPGPAHTIANMAAVRIGELLGPAQMGGNPKARVSSGASELTSTTRSEFRLMAQYRSVVEENSTVSRSQVLQIIKDVREDERALEALPPDLAERVRSDDDPMTLREAERVAKERQQRIDVWAGNIQEGLRTFGRMANYEVPDEVANRLSQKELDLLKLILGVLKDGDYGFLG